MVVQQERPPRNIFPLAKGLVTLMADLRHHIPNPVDNLPGMATERRIIGDGDQATGHHELG